MSADHCSFCRKTRKQVKVLIASKISGAMICDGCCGWAASPVAPVAFCSSCTVIDGKHAADCIEGRQAS